MSLRLRTPNAIQTILDRTPVKLEGPLFVAWRGRARTVGLSLVTVISMALGGLLIWAGVVDSSALLLLFGVIFVVFAVIPIWSLLLRTSKFSFYEDRFEADIPGSPTTTYSYFDIESVRCLNYDLAGAVFPKGFGPSPRILLNMYQNHKQTQLAINLNPYNKRLGMHLCDWLTRKTKAQ